MVVLLPIILLMLLLALMLIPMLMTLRIKQRTSPGGSGSSAMIENY